MGFLGVGANIFGGNPLGMQVPPDLRRLLNNCGDA